MAGHRYISIAYPKTREPPSRPRSMVARSTSMRPSVPIGRRGIIHRMLPDTGSVLGIDVGYSQRKRTTAFCSLKWTRDRIDWTLSSATVEPLSREQALRRILDSIEARFLSVAIDGPLKPGLTDCHSYRTAECILSRGAFQKRGKPGQTNAGSGPLLHKHATDLANMALEICTIDPSKIAVFSI
jgi:hypothetical protein